MERKINEELTTTNSAVVTRGLRHDPEFRRMLKDLGSDAHLVQIPTAEEILTCSVRYWKLRAIRFGRSVARHPEKALSIFTNLLS